MQGNQGKNISETGPGLWTKGEETDKLEQAFTKEGVEDVGLHQFDPSFYTGTYWLRKRLLTSQEKSSFIELHS